MFIGEIEEVGVIEPLSMPEREPSEPAPAAEQPGREPVPA